jgi:DNA (cytosine-5)-methyltransferase 1
MGEQVAGAAGYGWIDGVRSDLESESYAIEGIDIAACAVNAPHIRQRLYWVAMDNTKSAGLEGRFNNTSQPSVETRDGNIRTASGNPFDMVNSYSERRQEHGGSVSVQTEQSSVECSSSGRAGSWESVGSGASDLANANLSGSSRQCEQRWQPEHQKEAEGSGELCAGRSGFWDNTIWLNGADGKARRAKPRVRLLAHGVPARVGKLRAYGNAIVPQIAAEVIKAFMETGESHENT